MMEPQSEAKTDGNGQNEDEVRSKCLILPIEDVTLKYPLGRNCGEIPKWLIRWGEEGICHLRNDVPHTGDSGGGIDPPSLILEKPLSIRTSQDQQCSYSYLAG